LSQCIWLILGLVFLNSSNSTFAQLVRPALINTNTESIVYPANFWQRLNSSLKPTSSNSISLGDSNKFFNNIYTSTNGVVMVDGSGTNIFNVGVPYTLASNIILILPSYQGTAGQVLTNNGSGIMGWNTPIAGSGTNILIQINGVDLGSAGTINWTTNVTGYLAGATANLGVNVIGGGGSGLITNSSQFLGSPLSIINGAWLSNMNFWGNGTNNGSLRIVNGETILLTNGRIVLPDNGAVGTTLTGLVFDDDNSSIDPLLAGLSLGEGTPYGNVWAHDYNSLIGNSSLSNLTVARYLLVGDTSWPLAGLLLISGTNLASSTSNSFLIVSNALINVPSNTVHTASIQLIGSAVTTGISNTIHPNWTINNLPAVGGMSSSLQFISRTNTETASAAASLSQSGTLTLSAVTITGGGVALTVVATTDLQGATIARSTLAVGTAGTVAPVGQLYVTNSTAGRTVASFHQRPTLTDSLFNLAHGNTNVFTVNTNGFASWPTNYIPVVTSWVGTTNTSGAVQVWNISGTSGNIRFLNRTGQSGGTAAGVYLWTNTVTGSGSDIILGVNCGIEIDTGVGVIGTGRTF